MYYAGIDIGSTASKVCILRDDDLLYKFVFPTGWSSVKTANEIKNKLSKLGITINNCIVTATGYGRISVPFADKTITEITCHGKGAYYLLNEDCTVIDIGGQDTKIISIQNGNVTNFTMNDKCAAGTGRFLELMANTLGLTIDEMCNMAQQGKEVSISSMCTVFAESEVIGLIGSGKRREDIAYGIIDSVLSKVKTLCDRHGQGYNYFLTGGLCDNRYIVKKLSEKLQADVRTSELGRYAGAIGAAIVSKNLK